MDDIEDELEWRCTECGDEFTSTPERHSLDWCDCGEAFVDHEEHYIRRNFNTRAIE